MPKTKPIPIPIPILVRISTIPIIIGKLLEGQSAFMKDHFEVIIISAEKEKLEAYRKEEGVRAFHLEITRKITSIKDIIVIFIQYRLFKKKNHQSFMTTPKKLKLLG